ncbi:hypothetical protein L9F63_020697, partial [Diploptera punctata]
KSIHAGTDDFDHVFEQENRHENNGSGFIAENSGLTKHILHFPFNLCAETESANSFLVS